MCQPDFVTEPLEHFDVPQKTNVLTPQRTANWKLGVSSRDSIPKFVMAAARMCASVNKRKKTSHIATLSFGVFFDNTSCAVDEVTQLIDTWYLHPFLTTSVQLFPNDL